MNFANVEMINHWELLYDTAKLLDNGDRWERELSRNNALDAPYR